MNITDLNSFFSPTTLTPSNKISTGETENSGGNFGSLVKDAVESLDGSQKSAEQEIVKAVSGESPDLHRTIIELQTADLKFQLGLQVRNKLIGAYEEIMRMQV
ncbi:MAG: flagellar hook-basal body complex protein FliE [Pyrinomonadaceae bacterium]